MTDWIKIDPAELSITRQQQGEFEGTTIIFGLSPDDVPEKMRGRLLESGEFVIEFKYLTPTHEPRKKLSGDRPVTPVVGSHTGRLYELRFQAPVFRLLSAKARESINRLKRKYVGQKRHYEVVAEAVEDNAESLQPQ